VPAANFSGVQGYSGWRLTSDVIAAFLADASRRIVAEVEAVALEKKGQICRTNDARRAGAN